MIDEKLRDKIAIAAMAAIITKAPLHKSFDGDMEEQDRVDSIAIGAYFYADAMIKARQQ